MARLSDSLTAPLRRLRWAIAGWSPSRDREFHDHLFGGKTYDPLSPSYPGYLTIRRFADHAERHLTDVQVAIDLGCGPGEITCELARRRPGTRFLGIDHSEVAIGRARALAQRLGLRNAAFERGDLETYTPSGPVDLVMMFDAFHHVLAPAAFVERVGTHCSRFFLVEPAGTWSGSWSRRGDLDWLALTIGQIRQRLEYQFGLDDGPRAPNPGVGQPATPSDAEPTEFRYTRADLEGIFSGYQLELRGTIAGLDAYGVRPYDINPVRDRFGELTYQLVAGVEDILFEEGLDLAAKHWTIYASTHGDARVRDDSRIRHLRRTGTAPAASAAYGAAYSNVAAPAAAGPGEIVTVTLDVRNTGWLEWNSQGSSPVFLSYHWQDRRGRTLVLDGLRSPLPAVIPQGQQTHASVRVQAPEAVGDAVLAIDMVHEGVAWFSDEGVPPATARVRIRSQT